MSRQMSKQGKAAMFRKELERGAGLFRNGEYALAERHFMKCLRIDGNDRRAAAPHEAAVFWAQSQQVAMAAVKMMGERGFLEKFDDGEALELAGAMRKKFRSMAKPAIYFGLGRAYAAMKNGLDFDIYARGAFREALEWLGPDTASRYEKAMVHRLFAQVDSDGGHLAAAERLEAGLGQDW